MVINLIDLYYMEYVAFMFTQGVDRRQGNTHFNSEVYAAYIVFSGVRYLHMPMSYFLWACEDWMSWATPLLEPSASVR